MDLQAFLDAQRAGLVERLTEFLRERDALAGMEDEILDAVEYARIFYAPDACEDRYVVGTSTAINFYWREDNGFREFRQVAFFQQQHPEVDLEDEYGTKVTLEEFRKITERST